HRVAGGKFRRQPAPLLPAVQRDQAAQDHQQDALPRRDARGGQPEDRRRGCVHPAEISTVKKAMKAVSSENRTGSPCGLSTIAPPLFHLCPIIPVQWGTGS